MALDFEPFVDPPDATAGNAFHFGYRSTQTGTTLAAVSIPSCVVAGAIPLQLTASLTSKGTIIICAEVSRLSQMTSNNGFQEVPLAELVEQVLAADNLRRDEIGEPELDALLLALENSIRRVRATIALLKYRELDD